MKNITLSYSVPMDKVLEIEKKIKDTMKDVTYTDKKGFTQACTKGRAFYFLIRQGYAQVESSRKEKVSGEKE